MSNSVARTHAVVQQCGSAHCRVNYRSKHMQTSNSSSIKIRNNNSLNYSQTTRTDRQLKHCLRWANATVNFQSSSSPSNVWNQIIQWNLHPDFKTIRKSNCSRNLKKKQCMVTGKYRYSDTVVSQAQDLQRKRQHGIAVQSAMKQNNFAVSIITRKELNYSMKTNATTLHYANNQ